MEKKRMSNHSTDTHEGFGSPPINPYSQETETENCPSSFIFLNSYLSIFFPWRKVLFQAYASLR